MRADRLAAMTSLFSHLRARPWLLSSMLAGAAIAVLVPGGFGAITRGLLGWNAAVWLYLVLLGAAMLRADHEALRRVAVAQAEGARVVLGVVVLAAFVSLVGIVVELAAVKASGAPHGWPHLLLAIATVAGSWLLVPTMFALSYASAYHRSAHAGALRFPDADPAFTPHYSDFMYFSLTIAVAAQTADVSVASPAMRRLVLSQALVSFAFNTAILAFTINVAASLF